MTIYAGTLKEPGIYSHNWKTVVQQWSGGKWYGAFKKSHRIWSKLLITRNCPRPMFRRRWRTGGVEEFLSAISQPGQPPYAPSPEDNEKPYYTDKPDWDALGAMLLVGCLPYIQ